MKFDVVRLSLNARDLDDNLAAIGELDRIDDQIHDHLPQPVGITDKPIQNIAIPGKPDASAFRLMNNPGPCIACSIAEEKQVCGLQKQIE